MVGTGVSVKDNFALAFSFFRIVFFTHDVFSFLFMVNTPGSSINEKNRRASGGLFFLPIFLGYIYRLWIKPPWPQFISARLAALKLISKHS